MFGYIGHCAASIFEAIREPVFFCGFLFLLCFIAHLYKANGGRTWKYWASSGPVFILHTVGFDILSSWKKRNKII